MACPEPPTLDRSVRPTVVDAGAMRLSGLVAEPARPGPEPRALVVALHGSGMSASYFDGTGDPERSLLRLGAGLGYTVVAVDRPGYGRTAGALPCGRRLEDQVEDLVVAVENLAVRYPSRHGVFVVAHSFGAMVALAAADRLRGLVGLDVSGCGHVPFSSRREQFGEWRRNWGELRWYPSGTFRACTAMVGPTPAFEVTDAERWPRTFQRVACRIGVPTRFTFAEQEPWWRHDATAVADLRARLLAAPRVRVDSQRAAGHNIGLGWSARCYHLRALAFLEECLDTSSQTVRC